MAGGAHGCVLDTNAGRDAPDLRSGAPLAPVVEAAELGQGDDLGATSWSNLSRATCRCGLVERQVAAVVVIVGDVVPEQTKQVAVVDDHDAVEELAAGAADPAFGDAVLPRAPWRCRTKNRTASVPIAAPW